MRAAAKVWPTETVSIENLPCLYCACWKALDITSARMMSSVEGGMIWPSVPAVHTMPEASVGL